MGFAGDIKFRMLRQEDFSGLWVSRCSHSVLQREREGRRVKGLKHLSWSLGQKGRRGPGAKEYGQPPEARKGGEVECPLEPPGGKAALLQY